MLLNTSTVTTVVDPEVTQRRGRGIFKKIKTTVRAYADKNICGARSRSSVLYYYAQPQEK